MDKVRVALIGAGWWGKQHGRVLGSRTDVDFCAIVGRDPERTAQRAEARLGALAVGGDIDDDIIVGRPRLSAPAG